MLLLLLLQLLNELLLVVTDEAPKPLLDTQRVPDKIAPGDEFHLSCNVSYVAGRDVKLEWIVPSPQGIDVSFDFK